MPGDGVVTVYCCPFESEPPPPTGVVDEEEEVELVVSPLPRRPLPSLLTPDGAVEESVYL